MKNIVLLAGDGIGPELMQQAKKILDVLVQHLPLRYTEALLGGAAVDATGEPYPEATRQAVAAADAVLLACIGGPKWDTLPRAQRPESGLLALRADLGVYANLRPVQVWNPEASPLKPAYVSGLDVLMVRELTGGIYFGQPRGIREENGQRVGFNTEIYREDEIRRIAVMAFEAAMQRQKRLCSVDKMNVLESSQLWREVVNEVGSAYPEVQLTHMLVDNAAMQLVRAPKQFDVLLTNNLFGDILSDQASMLTGSIGLLPSASLRHDGVGLFEPIHGSAPDIAGQNRANPCAMLLSLALLLRYALNEDDWAKRLENAVQTALQQGWVTADMVAAGACAYGTNEVGDAIVKIFTNGL